MTELKVLDKLQHLMLKFLGRQVHLVMYREQLQDRVSQGNNLHYVFRVKHWTTFLDSNYLMASAAVSNFQDRLRMLYIT
jgi:hypothetical protein